MANTFSKILNSSEYKQKLSTIAKTIVDNAINAANEATIESRFDMELFAFFREFFGLYGIEYNPQKESSIDTGKVFKGRADSAINTFIVEFKQPRTLKSSNQQSSAINQIKGYINGILSKGINVAKGFVTDGVKCAFVSYQDGEFHVDDFLDLTGASLDQIVRIILDVNIRALSSANLVSEICNPPSNNGIGFILAKELYNLVQANKQPKTLMLFNEWKELFRLAHDDVSKQQAIIDRKKSLEGIFEESFGNNDNEYLALFCLQTSYAIIVKTLAFKIVSVKRFNKDMVVFSEILKLNSDELCNHLRQMEDGDIFEQYGILNLLEGDFFSWYTNKEQWSNTIAEVIKVLYAVLARFSGSPVVTSSNQCQDFFKELYQTMIPAPVRHSLGEYYTKKWLANSVVDEIVDKLPKNWKALDPCCGSGTFITSLIDHVLKECNNLDNKEQLEQVVTRVKGIDLNPIAVLTARVNYFINISELLDADTDVEIPIYLGDSSYIPKDISVDNIPCISYTISTLQNPIQITVPKSMIRDSKSFSQTMRLLEVDIKMQNVKSVYTKLLSLCKNEDLNEITEGSIYSLAKQLVELERRKWNGVWAKIISNYLNTVNLGKFDLVVGNPPWVDWKTLPSGYRDKIKSLCISRKLFSGDSITGGINLNICALITNVVAQHWLDESGCLAFLMPEPLLFQQSYEGFRNLYVSGDNRLFINKIVNWNFAGHPFAPVQQKFLTYYISNKYTNYELGLPVKFIFKKTRKNIDDLEELSFDDTFESKEYYAGTCNRGRNFFTYAKTIDDLKSYSVIGEENDIYIGREGIEFYPQELLVFKKSDAPDRQNCIALENIQNPKSKYKVSKGLVLLEKEMLRPMIKGKDVTPFHAEYKDYIVPFPYEKETPRVPVTLEKLQETAPNLATYYVKNRALIDAQTSYNETIIGQKDAEFYALARVGAYSFAKYSVVFRDNTKWAAAVSSPIETSWGGRKIPVFQNHACTISADSEGNYLTYEEAHFICGIMNSSIVNNYMMFSSDSRSFPVRLRFCIPKFDSTNEVHIKISKLSQDAHVNYKDSNYISKIQEELSTLYLKCLVPSSGQTYNILDFVEDSQKFTTHLPLYTLRAACGYFVDHEEPEVEGWVDVTSAITHPNKDMFMVHAKGDSMLPKIKDGDLCVFELYHGGSRNGEIVLTQLNERDYDYGGSYTIKKYHSEKVEEDGRTKNTKVELQPLNTDGYSAIEIHEETSEDFTPIAILKCVL